MDNMDLGALIVAGLCGIGLIQFIMWIVVMIRHPGCDDLRLDLVRAVSSQSRGRKRHHKGLPATNLPNPSQ